MINCFVNICSYIYNYIYLLLSLYGEVFIIGLINKFLTSILIILNISLLIYSYFYVEFSVLYPFICVLVILLCVFLIFFSDFIYIYSTIDVGNNLLVQVILFPCYLLLLLNFVSLPNENLGDMDKRLKDVSGVSSQNINNSYIKNYTLLEKSTDLSLDKFVENIKSYKAYYIKSKDMTFIIEAESLKFGYVKGNVLNKNSLFINKELLESLH